ncbi:Trafficking protein particle complex subunit 3-like protein [Astathelohania contejeani]|uniref:Trafficking protein particle complex subunit 3-like protein n=1 Tax=Astathelohania contejeani TaxID=164912 RepID=A0ABQ7I020_9MICR|nr:Trafficking protein particle complex subunit 3-like protein [Thelohania contejeani]
MNSVCNSTLFSLLYASTFRQLKSEDPEKINDKAFMLGIKIGQRISDDFFLRANIKDETSLQNFITLIATRFFPLYFEYSPKVINGSVFDMKDFFLVKNLASGEIIDTGPIKYLNIFCGIIQTIGEYLVGKNVRVVDVSEHERPMISIIEEIEPLINLEF